MRHFERSLVATVAACALLSGCITPAYRTAVSNFGTRSEAAMKAQADHLKAIEAAETERIRAKLAADGADLRLHDCGRPDTQSEGFRTCKLRRFGPGGTLEVEQAFAPANILALEGALAGYGKNLALLAADPAQDQAAFSTAITNLAGSVGKLDGAIAKATEGGRVSSDDKLGKIAGIVAKVGNLIFAYQRQRALKRIVIASNPLVEEAVGLLDDTDTVIQGYDVELAREKARSAQREASRIVADRPLNPVAIRKAQDALYEAVDALNAVGTRERQIRELGEVHAALAAAAKPGASRDQLAAALKRLIDWNAQFEV